MTPIQPDHRKSITQHRTPAGDLALLQAGQWIDEAGALIDRDRYGEAAIKLRRAADELVRVEESYGPQRDAQEIAQRTLDAAFRKGLRS